LAEITRFRSQREKREASEASVHSLALALALLIIIIRRSLPYYFYSLWRRSRALLPIYTRGNNAFIQTVVTPLNLNLVSRKHFLSFSKRCARRKKKKERRAQKKKKERRAQKKKKGVVFSNYFKNTIPISSP
jgi:hypothetical protein